MKEDLLFSLIRSLDKSEKRYFVLHQGVYKGVEPGNSMQLFDALEKEKTYDESAFLSKYNKKKFTRFYRAEKQQLQNLLLLSLGRMQVDRKQALQLRGKISAAELLLEKRQLTLARKLLIKARETAIEVNHYEIALDALTIETRLYTAAAKMTQLQELYAVRKKMLDLITQEDHYASLIIEFLLAVMRLMSGKDPEAKNLIEAIKNDAALQQEENALSPKAKVMLHHFWANYYFIFPNRQLYYYHFVKQFEVCAANLLFAQAHLHVFTSILLNTIATAYNMSQLKQLEEVKQFFKSFVPAIHKSVDKSLLLEFETLELLTDLYVHLLKSDFASVVAHRKKTLDLIAIQLPEKVMLGMLVFSLATAQFALEEYRACIRTLQLYRNSTKEVYVGEIKLKVVLLMQVLCHYKLGNMDVVEQQATNALRQEKKEISGFQMLEQLLEFMLVLTGENNSRKVEQEASILHEKLSKQNQSTDQTMLKFTLFFSIWLESFRSGEPFSGVWKKSIHVV